MLEPSFLASLGCQVVVPGKVPAFTAFLVFTHVSNIHYPIFLNQYILFLFQMTPKVQLTLPVLAAAQRTRLSRLPERGRRVVRERFKRYLFLRWLFFFIY